METGELEETEWMTKRKTIQKDPKMEPPTATKDT